jgi:hypothetical protein
MGVLEKMLRLVNSRFLSVRLDDCVNIGGFDYSNKDEHPLLAVLQEFDQGKSNSHKDSILTRFYNEYTCNKHNWPLSVGQKVGLKEIEYIPPWGGGKKVDPRNDFEHWIGPKTNDQIDAFLKYFKKLYDYIKVYKYRPMRNIRDLIWVHKLVGYEKTKFLVVGGQKRSSILKHCGFKKATVLLQSGGDVYPLNMPSVINVREVAQWRNVKNNKFTNKEATDFFEQYFKENSWRKSKKEKSNENE